MLDMKTNTSKSSISGTRKFVRSFVRSRTLRRGYVRGNANATFPGYLNGREIFLTLRRGWVGGWMRKRERGGRGEGEVKEIEAARIGRSGSTREFARA